MYGDFLLVGEMVRDCDHTLDNSALHMLLSCHSAVFEDLGADLRWRVLFFLTIDIAAIVSSALVTLNELEWPCLDVLLDKLIIELLTNKSLRVVKSVFDISHLLNLCCSTDKSIVFSTLEGHHCRNSKFAELIRYYLDLLILPDSKTHTRRPQIYPDPNLLATGLIDPLHHINV